MTRNWALSRRTPETHLIKNQVQRKIRITCRLARCVTHYDTAFDVLRERRDVFENLRVYPDCMTILSLQYNPMLSHYGVRVQDSLGRGVRRGIVKKGDCLTAVGNPCSAHFV